jgi:molybdenum cofactor biosynthesis enzyme
MNLWSAGGEPALQCGARVAMKLSYFFEELTDDLPNPPRSAIRAMFAAGVVVSPRGWNVLTTETRQALAMEGTRDVVNVAMVAQLLNSASPSHIRLVAKVPDPSSEEIPLSLMKALKPRCPLTVADWKALHALDRCVLASLATNTRLFWRALHEMSNRSGAALSLALVQPWTGVLAHCEVRMQPEAVEHLTSPRFLEGRACVLARVAGIRAARRISETMDLHSESATGPTELDWGLTGEPGVLLWQAHISSWDGEFFPSASLLAAATAAVAVHDMAKELDPEVKIGTVNLVEEAWKVGLDREEPTQAYTLGTDGPKSSSRPAAGPVPSARSSRRPAASSSPPVAAPLAAAQLPMTAPASSALSGVSKKSVGIWLLLIVISAALVSTIVAFVIARLAGR